MGGAGGGQSASPIGARASLPGAMLLVVMTESGRRNSWCLGNPTKGDEEEAAEAAEATPLSWTEERWCCNG